MISLTLTAVLVVLKLMGLISVGWFVVCLPLLVWVLFVLFLATAGSYTVKRK
jgi:hypothetical protein